MSNQELKREENSSKFHDTLPLISIREEQEEICHTFREAVSKSVTLFQNPGLLLPSREQFKTNSSYSQAGESPHEQPQAEEELTFAQRMSQNKKAKLEQTVGHRVEVANKQLIKNIHRIYNRKPYY